MSELAHQQREEQDRKKGLITSSVLHILLLLLAFLPFLTYPNPPPGQPGILVALGQPDEGQGDNPNYTEDPASEPIAENKVEPEPEPEPEPEKPVAKPEPAKPKTDPKPNTKPVLTDDNSDEIALKKKKDKEERDRRELELKQAKEIADKKAREDAEAKQKAAEAEAKRKAEAEAEAKKKAEAAAKQKAYEDQKGKTAGMFGKNKPGTGQGNTGTPGNQGDPNGDPNSKNLEGISTGTGDVGGGLAGRELKNRPTITDNSQEEGKVVVKICVNKEGKVETAEYTQKGSTASSSRLRDLAVRTAYRYTFSPSEVDNQCGTITFNFKLK